VGIKSISNGGLSGGKFTNVAKSQEEPVDPFQMEYLIAAGGGGGGDRRAHPGWGMHNGGAGGGGGLIEGNGVLFQSGVDYAISIGGAGSQGSGSDGSKTNGGNGGDTTVVYKDGTYTAIGGGGGGVGSASYEAGSGTGQNGGSGGGGGTHFQNLPYNSDGGRAGGTGTVGQGNDGGDGGRGGGAQGGAGGSYLYAGANKGGRTSGKPFYLHTGLEITRTLNISNSDEHGLGNSAQGGGTSSNGGGGMVYIIFDSSLTCTIGAGLTGSQETYGDKTHLFLQAGSGNISFS